MLGTICLLVSIVILVYNIIFFRIAIDVVEKILSGYVFVRVWYIEGKSSGWVRRSSYYSFINGRKAEYEIIEIESHGGTELVNVGEITRFKEERRITKIVLGSLL